MPSKPVVALRELIDLVGGDVAVEGDLDVLAPLVGGPPQVGDAQDRQFAPPQWERTPLQLIAVESPERLGQLGVADERSDDGEPFGVVGVARSESGHAVARHAQQRAIGGVLLVAPLVGGERTQAQIDRSGIPGIVRFLEWHGWIPRDGSPALEAVLRTAEMIT